LSKPFCFFNEGNCCAKFRPQVEPLSVDKQIPYVPYVFFRAIYFFQLRWLVLFSDPKLNHSLRVNEGQLMTNALNAFLIFVSKKGLVYCVSEDVYDHLGLRQVCSVVCRTPCHMHTHVIILIIIIFIYKAPYIQKKIICSYNICNILMYKIWLIN